MEQTYWLRELYNALRNPNLIEGNFSPLKGADYHPMYGDVSPLRLEDLHFRNEMVSEEELTDRFYQKDSLAETDPFYEAERAYSVNKTGGVSFITMRLGLSANKSFRKVEPYAIASSHFHYQHKKDDHQRELHSFVNFGEDFAILGYEPRFSREGSIRNPQKSLKTGQEVISVLTRDPQQAISKFVELVKGV